MVNGLYSYGAFLVLLTTKSATSYIHPFTHTFMCCCLLHLFCHIHTLLEKGQRQFSVKCLAQGHNCGLGEAGMEPATFGLVDSTS